MLLKIGFVDTGFIAEFQITGFNQDPRCKVCGVTRSWRENVSHASQKAKLDAFAEKYELEVYDDFDALVAAPDIAAIVIASINNKHFDYVMRAIEHGKHVLIEKPVARTIEELEIIKKRAAEKNVVVMPAHNFSYRDAVVEAKRLIKSGIIGKIQYGSFTQSFLCDAVNNQWRSSHDLAWGGALMDSGTHLVYQTIQLLGAPNKVQAMSARNVLDMDDEDIAAIQLQYPNGTIVHLMQNWGSAHGEDIEGIRLVGSAGRISISDALYLNGEKVNSDTEYADSFKRQATAFIAAILDEQPPQSNLDDAKLTLRIIDAAYQSAASGKSIVI